MNFTGDAACRRITAIDLFCGAGGFSLAAGNLGIHVLAALENDSNACGTVFLQVSLNSYVSRISSNVKTIL